MSSGLISPPHVAGYPGDFTVQGGAPFGFWNHTLASLHANPAHSALRRARHFFYAIELHEYGDRDWFDGEAWKAASEAAARQLWSVR